MLPRPNWIEIDLDALSHNIASIKKRIPHHTKFLFPVKADAYGHGSLACSFAAQKIGVDMLGVAHLFEGIDLKRWGITIPVLVLGPLLLEDFPYLVRYKLTPTITSLDVAIAFDEFLKSKGLKWRVHLKIDTGMGRYGFDSHEISDILKVFDLKNIEVEGIFSHMACSENTDAESNHKQIEQFKEVLNQLPIVPFYVHLANSAAVFNYPETHFSMIRPGLASYGYSPLKSSARELGLKPVLALKATIRQVKWIAKGTSVSYGHRWTASQPTKVASVAIGYGDGYFRNALYPHPFFVDETPCNTLGTICMDTTLIDVTHLENAHIGQEVSIIDGAHHSKISLEKLAESLGTIPYEISCRMARRLYRKYLWQGKILDWNSIRQELDIQEPKEPLWTTQSL